MEHISNALERCLTGPHIEAAPPPDDDSATIFYNLPPEPPLEALPPEIRQMLKQASVSFKHAPIEVPLVGFLSLLTICVGRSRALEVKTSWQEAGNIYIALVGDSGVGKSHCFNVMLKPVWDEDFRRKQEWEAAMADYHEIMDARSKDKVAALTEPPSKPVRVQHLIEDATIEAIGQTMSENPRGLLWVVDELAGLIGSLDRYSSGKSDSGVKSRLISAYDCLPWKTSRSDRDKNQSSSATFLSITSTTQPEILKGLFSRRDALSGFLPRFIFILTKRRRPSFLTEEVFTGQPLLEMIAKHMLAWEMIQDNNGSPMPQKIKLSPEAYSLFEGWHNQKAGQAWEREGIEQMLTPKLTTQVLHLALLLHCLKAALEGTDGLSMVTGETMREAITLGDWVGVHQMRVWNLLGLDQEEIVETLDEAIVMVCLGLEGFLKVNGWKIVNDDFNRKVADKYGQSVSSTSIGKAASRLGIKPVNIGKKRGKEISGNLLKAFRDGHQVSACRQRRTS
ncbi:DUF3987 domain-containing protein [Deltaproteobacteria bacterium OttesenSCG-928-K17]|nr:DUF3987 domain-containing protein [Deltaproteobacteria bacterium OttesenSCG-928-K17]